MNWFTQWSNESGVRKEDMTDQDREEIKWMIERAITCRIGNVTYATNMTAYPVGTWFTINPQPVGWANEPCMDYSLGVKVYRCATVCADLPNCKLKEKNECGEKTLEIKEGEDQ